MTRLDDRNLSQIAAGGSFVKYDQNDRNDGGDPGKPGSRGDDGDGGGIDSTIESTNPPDDGGAMDFRLI